MISAFFGLFRFGDCARFSHPFRLQKKILRTMQPAPRPGVLPSDTGR
ncbi:hypothetical protein MBELCI_1626 [Limimaricola cinnabarinus LL-001]|uniref:Uncharacterized protein n=1 Tax=Limimaricola cinnabarinus LL-001 TaxID=1337093 RepID=U3AD25_9RHOB|nr:hypothetical protein MBELCI_1626 [Limimaricola cinnabarinus LL-001]